MSKLLVTLILCCSLSACVYSDVVSSGVYSIENDIWSSDNAISQDVFIGDTVGVYSLVYFVSSIDSKVDNVDIRTRIMLEGSAKVDDTVTVVLRRDLNKSLIAKERKDYIVAIDSIRFPVSGQYTISAAPTIEANISAFGMIIKKIQ